MPSCRTCALLAIPLALALAGSATAQDAASTAKAFGARERILDISLAPDGSRIAMIVPSGPRGSAVQVVDPLSSDAPITILRVTGDTHNLRDCSWVTSSRLVCRLLILSRQSDGIEVFTRLIAVDSDGKNTRVVTPRATERSLYFNYDGGGIIDWTGDGQGRVLISRQYVPESTIGTKLASSDEGLGVEIVDTATLERRRREPGRREAVEYITDGIGTVRIMGLRPNIRGAYSANVVNYFYRQTGSSDWKPLSKLQLDGGNGKGFNPYRVDPKLNAVYGFDDAGGRLALWRVALDGSMKRELVVSHPQVDVDQLLLVGRQNRVVGASFATEHREATFFDPELAKLSVDLGKALPKQPIVSFVDASADERVLLLFAGSDIDPGRYYVFRKQDRHLTEILPARPELAAFKLATMTPVTFPAADGTSIPGYLTLPAGSDGKNLPAIVMPHGGPSSRDEWGFDWWVQFFAARGFAVLQPNFRGSSGYGADWFKNNGFRSWRLAIGDVADAGRWLVRQGIARPDRLAIVDWSYGGYAALQSSVVTPDLFKAVIAVAPVTDLAALKQNAMRYTNYPEVQAMIGEGPHVRDGSPARNAVAIRAPVLMFHGDLDLNVQIIQSRLMADELRDARKPVTFIEYKGLEHSLLDDDARAEMLEKSDAFLRKSMGM